MAKVSFISPRLLLKKVNDFFQDLPKKKDFKTLKENEIHLAQDTTENLQKKYKRTPNLQKNIDLDKILDDSNTLETPKLNLSMKDIKIISTSLLYFQKYLKSKGQNDKADEVAEVDKRLFEFIHQKEQNKK